MKQRWTRQLEAVNRVLRTSADHPTAEQVWERIHTTQPRLSLGTVYRNLEKLRDQHKLRVVRTAGGVAHYDGNLHDHDHFICDHCGGIVDLDAAVRRLPPNHLVEAGYHVDWQSTALHGCCPGCAGLLPRPGGADR
jgi:Fur family transcriptional regulator, peroxide stress response regulator